MKVSKKPSSEGCSNFNTVIKITLELSKKCKMENFALLKLA